MRGAVATGAIVAAVFGGCGGGGAKLTSAEIGKISHAEDQITGYCQNQQFQQQTPPSSSTGGEVAQLKASVDLLIAEYKAHKTERFSFVAGPANTTLALQLRQMRSALNAGNCAPDLAQRIDQELPAADR